jgi:hypothetical protein
VRHVEEAALVCGKFPLEIKKPPQDPFLFWWLWESHPFIVRVFLCSSFHDLTCLLCPSSLFKVFREEIADMTISARGDFLKIPLLELSLRFSSALL